MVYYLLSLAAAYLAGSVNFAILLFKLLGKADPRTRFSQNPGVTNVYRQAGWAMALLVLVLDVGRAAAVALLGRYLFSLPWVPWLGLTLILGNHYPCFHDFHGGKGVANFLGFCAPLIPLGTVAAVGVYGLVFWLRRVPFVASFAMVGVLAGFSLGRWGQWPAAAVATLVTVGLIVWFHRANMAELAARKRPGE